ncbi:hypothetical protein KIW84_056605 [Lathyrus oleraceus]|uniref:Pentatricopeptide repeat-containing protein n=1 Tax=Pisum sativum TaxID=3888 RepID=A0A9D4WZY5_PEA|nr:hypothetical protein KIW84_056605 [Pisum sativum]
MSNVGSYLGTLWKTCNSTFMLRVYKLDMGIFSSYQPHHLCSSTSRLRASMSIPDQTHFEDHDTVRLFCSNALKISAEKGYLPEGKQLHARLIKFGFCHVLSLQNQILSVYLKCKETEDAEKLFDGLPVRNVVSWNIMIRGIVGSCDNENELDRKQLCFSYFKRMLLEMPDLVTWTSLICAYAFHGLAKEATEMFEKMLSRGIIPDKIAFLGVLTACAHRGLVTKGLHISECCHKFISKWPWQKKLVEISKVAYHSHQPARKYKSTQVSL